MAQQSIQPVIDITRYAEKVRLEDGIYFSLNRTAVSYPEEGNKSYFEIEENSFWFKHRNSCITQLVKKYSPNEVFFDVGGGNGFVSKGLQDAGIPTVLVEPGLQGALNATKRGLQNVVCSTLEDAGFKRNIIPAIGAFDVVEHIEDDDRFLTNMFSYLTHNGLVFITVPAYAFLWSAEDKVAGHFRRYTLPEITKTLQTAGFRIEYATYIFSILPVPIFLTRSLPSLWKRGENGDNSEKHKAEHASPRGIMHHITDRIWKRELTTIQNGGRIPFGSSCLVVGRKVS